MEEGFEEVKQGVMTNVVNKATFDFDKEIFSDTDQNAVINISRMVKEFGSGAILGGLFGGVNLTFDGIITANNDAAYRGIGKAVANTTNVQEIIDFSKSTKNDDIRTIARTVNAKNITDADIGRLYQYEVRTIKEKFDDVSCVG